jgi:hypothetical protein
MPPASVPPRSIVLLSSLPPPATSSQSPQHPSSVVSPRSRIFYRRRRQGVPVSISAFCSSTSLLTRLINPFTPLPTQRTLLTPLSSVLLPPPVWLKCSSHPAIPRHPPLMASPLHRHPIRNKCHPHRGRARGCKSCSPHIHPFSDPSLIAATQGSMSISTTISSNADSKKPQKNSFKKRTLATMPRHPSMLVKDFYSSTLSSDVL